MKYNIGAENEEDVGKYFQFADLIGYRDPSHSYWATSPVNNGSEDLDMDYFNTIKDMVCPNGILSERFDGAYRYTHGLAKIPTLTQYKELMNNTDVEWTSINGINGRKFMSKKVPTKYIFIPAGGYNEDGVLNDLNDYGDYWSSTFDTTRPTWAYAWNFDFYSGGQNYYYNELFYSFLIRAVKV